MSVFPTMPTKSQDNLLKFGSKSIFSFTFDGFSKNNYVVLCFRCCCSISKNCLNKAQLCEHFIIQSFRLLLCMQNVCVVQIQKCIQLIYKLQLITIFSRKTFECIVSLSLFNWIRCMKCDHSISASCIISSLTSTSSLKSDCCLSFVSLFRLY